MSVFDLPTEPPEFKALTEISIIAHLADNLFASILPEGLTTAQFGVLNYLLRIDSQETISEIVHLLSSKFPHLDFTNLNYVPHFCSFTSKEKNFTTL